MEQWISQPAQHTVPLRVCVCVWYANLDKRTTTNGLSVTRWPKDSGDMVVGHKLGDLCSSSEDAHMQDNHKASNQSRKKEEKIFLHVWLWMYVFKHTVPPDMETRIKEKNHKQTDNLFQYQIKQKYVWSYHMENIQNEVS